MNNIIIDGVVIKINGFVKQQSNKGIMYITDSEVADEQFKDFLRIYDMYSFSGEYFNSMIEDINFHGRFGQLIYSKSEFCYKLRLVFVDSKYDSEDNFFPSFDFQNSVSFINMTKRISEQELIINNLINILNKNNLINDDDVRQLKKFNQEDIKEIRFRMSREVDDLDKYLTSIHDNLTDIEKE